MYEYKQKTNNSYSNIDTWKIMFDFYMYMKNRDWVEIVEEDREREKLQQKNTNYSQNFKNKANNSEKVYKVPKRYSFQTPTESFNNKRRDVSDRSLIKECKTVKSRPLTERKRCIRQRPELRKTFAETATKNN